jgi:hypothetical protein
VGNLLTIGHNKDDGVSIMEHDPRPDSPNEQMAQLAQTLEKVRDSWVLMSLLIKDWMAQTQSVASDAAQAEVDQCLRRMREKR